VKRCLLALLLALAAPAAGAVPATPGDSLYVMNLALTDQAGASTGLDRYRGSPVLVSLFYSACPNACPLLISAIQRFERELPEARRGRLRVLLVSLDPDGDTVDKLAEVAARHHADPARWTFARTDPRSVRKLAAALGIQYRRQPNGSFNHSTVITLLDPAGRPLARTVQLLRPDEKFQAALAQAVTSTP
jgi:protein SCO1/2